MRVLLLTLFLAVAKSTPVTESYKDQYCTDPRTSHRHAAYTEWADAYSCTRHRCQPGGRNLAIYTVGCKRVEAPESAIECEEVVEDTNMQFPFCCTRLRCLVVVRGEVWTRVLGQPWETLPAAPWSHMYKMKKPPPGDVSFGIKSPEQGPVYELTESDSDGPREKVVRASKATTEAPGFNDAVQRAAVPPPPAPDIVIALSTDPKSNPLENIGGRRKRVHTEQASNAHDSFFDDEKEHLENDGNDNDNHSGATEKPLEPGSDERFFGNGYAAVTQKSERHQPWTEIPQSQWNENEPGADTDSVRENQYIQQDFNEQKPDEKPSNLQALVDAIGSRMRDIEHVVQRMSEKVHAPGDEPRTQEKTEAPEEVSPKFHKKELWKPKRPGADQDHYKRFSVRNRGSKYVHTAESTTEIPLFVKESGLSGYFSDASNSVLRRLNGPKEPIPTYMAPVDTRRVAAAAAAAPTPTSEEQKKKKRQHKKKKGKHHKKHHIKKKFNRVSTEDKNVVSQEDSGDAAT